MPLLSTLDGRKVIPYEHFSVVLHKDRRLAIFTASNVDGSAKAKRPEPGKDYSRNGLTGLTDKQQEKWVLDSRVAAQFQIPDAFYNQDNGAFDKGHIVRREDVCFGTSFAQVRRGYETVYTPNIGRVEMYETIGHFPYYRDTQFAPIF